MGRNEGKRKQEMFTNALQGKQVPVLTLDSKWYRLLDEVGRVEVKGLEDQLNNLLKRQGKLNTDIKDIKKLKKKLMGEIVTMADEADANGNRKKEKQIAEHKRLVEECNEKLESYQDELIDIPHEIDRVNIQLMLHTMECCYDIMQENTDAIKEITEWVTKIRVELKKNLVRKQEMEQRNHDIYSYMHDIFGADVINIFDMRYNPEEHHPKKKAELHATEKDGAGKGAAAEQGGAGKGGSSKGAAAQKGSVGKGTAIEQGGAGKEAAAEQATASKGPVLVQEKVEQKAAARESSEVSETSQAAQAAPETEEAGASKAEE
ncbi:MAG: hypothetical protein NC417_06490 [Candidatus Gastranaerophilales bacterium]|nr:hypothetical protein [Candidatus Gastranaerophilales bacterium]